MLVVRLWLVGGGGKGIGKARLRVMRCFDQLKLGQ